MHLLAFACPAIDPDIVAASSLAAPAAPPSPPADQIWSVVLGGLAVVFGSLVLAFVARLLNSRRKESYP